MVVCTTGISRTPSGGGIHSKNFLSLVSVANLLAAWKEFRRGKRGRADVARLEFSLEDELFALEEELLSLQYVPQPYESFYVHDPKRRHIHKAPVRDRVVHQALCRTLLPLFDPGFIFDSFSSRLGKGVHLGVARLERGTRQVTKNWKQPAYMLKCDVQKFFDSIDQNILFELIQKKVFDPEVTWLISLILRSFEKSPGKGLPLGNVTSQLFANIYLNELDQFVKHTLKVRYYFRYCDDFILLDKKKEVLESHLVSISFFLRDRLGLMLHPRKVFLHKIGRGMDFLGYVIRPHSIVPRTKTKRRIWKKLRKRIKKYKDGMITEAELHASLQSYLGVLSHGDAYELSEELKNDYWFWLQE